MSQPFIIFALPRSRTAWLASYLSYKDWQCGHETAILLRSVQDVKGLFALQNVGVVETAAAQAWRILKHHIPNLKMAVIRRPIDDVVQSMMNINLHGRFHYDADRLRKVMEYGDRMLNEISEQPGTLTLSFSDLETEVGCKAIFEHCLPYEFDPDWWGTMKDRNVQVDVAGVIQYYHDHKDAIEAFKRSLRSELRTLVHNGHIQKRQVM